MTHNMKLKQQSIFLNIESQQEMLINLVIDKEKNEIAVMPENMKSPAKVVAAQRI